MNKTQSFDYSGRFYMPDAEEHVYTREDLISRFEQILNKTLGEIDDLDILSHAEEYDLQKGIAGTIIEQCVLRYPPDREQKPDLIVVDGDNRIPTELKTTGIRVCDNGGRHFVAKEPMSITAVGVYDIAEQSFYDSHFWKKIQHLLIVYYLYLSDRPVPATEYASFPIKGYEFHQFNEADIETLKQDWSLVRDLCSNIVSNLSGNRNSDWKNKVKQEYIRRHSSLRRLLSYIELVPRFPPRFRLKKPVVNTMVANHFGFKLEQLPGKYTTISDIDRRCRELQQNFAGWSINDLAELFDLQTSSSGNRENKSIAEQIVVRMFGGKSKKLNRIELFQRFGLIAKTITVTSSGGRTEDMKLFHIDFSEMTKTEYYDDDGTVRDFEFEDSELYNYFAGNEFLCILFEEPERQYIHNHPENENRKEAHHPLGMNKFKGFQRLVFSEEFINTVVRSCWEDTRRKIFSHTLADVAQRLKNGKVVYLKNGEVSTAPNFMKSSQNAVFIRGGGADSSSKNKTERVNGIHMLPQFIWLKGSAVIDELGIKRVEHEAP